MTERQHQEVIWSDKLTHHSSGVQFNGRAAQHGNLCAV